MSTNELVKQIFGKAPGNPHSINIDLEEESFEDLKPGEDRMSIVIEFLTELMFTGIRYLYGDDVNFIEVLHDPKKSKLILEYMASVGWVPLIAAGRDPTTGDIVSYRISFDPAPLP